MVKRRPLLCNLCDREMRMQYKSLPAEVGREHVDCVCRNSNCREKGVTKRLDLLTGCTGFPPCAFHDTPPNQRCPDPYVECTNADH